jgi:hypothetical protein
MAEIAAYGSFGSLENIVNYLFLVEVKREKT